MPIPLRASSPGRPAHSEEVAEASLLLSRMTVLGLDAERFARSQPGMMQELRTACAACRNVRRCAFDLATSANGVIWPEWWDFCPNEARLNALVAAQFY